MEVGVEVGVKTLLFRLQGWPVRFQEADLSWLWGTKGSV